MASQQLRSLIPGILSNCLLSCAAGGQKVGFFQRFAHATKEFRLVCGDADEGLQDTHFRNINADRGLSGRQTLAQLERPALADHRIVQKQFTTAALRISASSALQFLKFVPASDDFL